VLRSSADQAVVAAIESVVRDGSDRQLCRINAVSFTARHGPDEEKTISGFLHAATSLLKIIELFRSGGARRAIKDLRPRDPGSIMERKASVKPLS
jgi:hypothetical protein